MSKRTVFTTVTPLPAGMPRELILETLHSHVDMIDLNPLVIDRFPCKAPGFASPEEFHCIWYQLTDKVSYLPGGLVSSNVSYFACFHDLANGVQTHCFAPLGLNIKGKWTLGGSLPGEPKAPVELGVGMPKDGLWLREDVDMKCNIMMTNFVKKTLKKAHATLVDRLVEKAKIREVAILNEHLTGSVSTPSSLGSPGFPPASPAFRQASLYSTGGSSSAPSSVSTFNSPALPYQQLIPQHPAAMSPAYGHVDPAYQAANPYADSKHPYIAAPPYSDSKHPYHAYQPPPPPHPPMAAELAAQDDAALKPRPLKQTTGSKRAPSAQIPDHPVELA